MSPFSSSECGKSLLLPSTRTGMPASCGLSNKLCSSFLEASIFSESAASTMYLRKKTAPGETLPDRSNVSMTTYTMALTPLQYLSHMDLKRGWPPMSHTLMVTLPLVILRMLKPTVGIMSSLNWPD